MFVCLQSSASAGKASSRVESATDVGEDKVHIIFMSRYFYAGIVYRKMLLISRLCLNLREVCYWLICQSLCTV